MLDCSVQQSLKYLGVFVVRLKDKTKKKKNKSQCERELASGCFFFLVKRIFIKCNKETPQRARSNWHKTRLNRWLVEHKFSVMTMPWDGRGGAKDRECWGDNGEDPANKLTDMSFHALSGVEIIISQQVELSTVTFAPLKCPWARRSVSTSTGGSAPPPALWSDLSLDAVLSVPPSQAVSFRQRRTDWGGKEMDPRAGDGASFYATTAGPNESRSYGETRVNSLLPTLKTPQTHT